MGPRITSSRIWQQIVHTLLLFAALGAAADAPRGYLDDINSHLITPQAILSEIESVADEIAALESQGEVTHTIALATYSALTVMATGLISQGIARYFYTAKPLITTCNPIDSYVSGTYIREGLAVMLRYILPASVYGSLLAIVSRYGVWPAMQSHEFPNIISTQLLTTLVATGLGILDHTLIGKSGVPDILNPYRATTLAMAAGVVTAIFAVGVMRYKKHFTYMQLKLQIHSLRRQYARALNVVLRQNTNGHFSY
ncbi:hypothetical protein [Sansalvadorimonas verongulae]|uniref:hypothetical protein n=1 Tax=Sansalvadorimonas verongulae TaxID=2172824 RepID=UPI0012BCAA8F|nr:hypothetical protein [Sansalvadorimonas verongulae]MTI14377.1 hypothetical protein [Sansalvadorimonas verongulae]